MLAKNLNLRFESCIILQSKNERALLEKSTYLHGAVSYVVFTIAH